MDMLLSTITWILCKNKKNVGNAMSGFIIFFVHVSDATQNLQNRCKTLRFVIRYHGNGDY